MGSKYKEEKHIKYCLASALVELMKLYPFDKITINEICYTAHVGRATYYHYAKGKHGKEDLLSFKLERDYAQYISQRRASGLSDWYGGGDILNFVYDNQELFRLLHTNRLNNVLIQYLQKANDPNAMSGDNAFISSYVTFGYLGVIYQWHLSDFQQKPEEVARIIYEKYAEIINQIIMNRLNSTEQ